MAQRTPTPAQHLLRRGHQYLAEGNYQRALDISVNLRNLRSSGAYEIGAMAHAGLGQVDEAVDVLEEGVEVDPDRWLLWQLLGNYRSELGAYDAAAEAYEQALRRPYVWTESVRLNQAVLALRRSDHAAALQFIADLEQSILRLSAVPIHMSALEGLGRPDEAEAIGERMLNETSATPDTASPLGAIAARIARLRLDRDDPRPEIRRFALKWLARTTPHPDLLAVIREVDDLYSPEARHFRLLVDASIPPGGRPAEGPARDAAGYYVRFDAVADSDEEALGFLLALEQEIPDVEFMIDEKRELGPRPSDPKGIYTLSPRRFYRHE